MRHRERLLARDGRHRIGRGRLVGASDAFSHPYGVAACGVEAGGATSFGRCALGQVTMLMYTEVPITEQRTPNVMRLIFECSHTTGTAWTTRVRIASVANRAILQQ
jgi:hypothetical protein